MASTEGIDWEDVASLNPKGDLEIQRRDQGDVIRGPLESITVDDHDNVVIKLKWAARMPTPGNPGFGTWEVAADEYRIISFPNLVMPYVVEDTPEKGRRVRFGLNILYLESTPEVNTLDPKRVNGLKL
jgi:hypothetical protein